MSMFSLRPALKAVVHTHPEEEAAWEDSTKSLAFDASSTQYAQASSLAYALDGAVSISAWIKFPDPLPTGYYVIWSSGDSGSYWARHIFYFEKTSAGELRLWIQEAEGGGGTTRLFDKVRFFSPTSPSTFINPQYGDWQHFAFTSASTSSAAGTVKVYLNGTELNSWTGTQNTGSPTQTKPTIGATAYTSGSAVPWEGGIDQVAIYPHALSASDVAALCGPDNYQRKPQTPYLSSGDPIHLWAMGEYVTGSTMPDQIGSVDMTLYNSPTVSTDVAPAAYSNAWSTKFDGVDDYMTGDMPYDPSGAWTCSVWFKLSATSGTGTRAILETYTDGSDAWTRQQVYLDAYSIDTVAGTCVFRALIYTGYIYDSGGLLVESAGVTLGDWHHYVVTVSASGGDANFYLDGSQIGTTLTAPTYNASYAIDSVILGGRKSSTSVYYLFDGHIDEAVFWNRAITSSEVTALNSTGPTDPMNTSGVTSDAVAWYRMGDRWDEGTVRDQIGSVDLTSVSAPEPEEDVPALWTPAEITTTAWFDAQDTATITESSGSVSQWADKSGNAKHAAQATANNQPQYNASGFGSGLASLTFDGDSDGAYEDRLATPSDTFAASAEVSMFAVMKDLTGGSTLQTVVFAGTTTGTQGIGLGFDTGSRFFSYIWGYGANYVYDTPGTDVIGVSRPSAGSDYTSMHINGTTTVDTVLEDLTINSSGGYLTIGSRYSSGFGANVEVGEVVALSTEPSTGDRQKIEGYLAWKWDGGSAGTLVGKLPATHPYKSAAPTT